MRRSSALAPAMLSALLAIPTAVHAQTPQAIYGCADNKGVVNTFQVATAPTCKKSETLITWNLVGPVGPQGVQGPVGAVGPQGPIGLTGATGAQGPQGATGAVGPQGPAGANGNDGAVGPQGPAGANGKDGAVGPQGPAGANGNDGAVGPQGPAGANGKDGPQGPVGANGHDGAPGATGPQGAPGANGHDGAQGPAGTQGSQGPAGPQGPAGSQGPQGVPGATGPAGAVPDMTSILNRLSALESLTESLDPIDQALNSSNLPFPKGSHYFVLESGSNYCNLVGDGFDFSRIIYIYSNTLFPGTLTGRGSIGFQNSSQFVPNYNTSPSVVIAPANLTTWCGRNSYTIR